MYYTPEEKKLIRAIMKANNTGDYSPVLFLMEDTENASEIARHQPSVFQVRSRAYARHLVNQFLEYGYQPVFTETGYGYGGYDYICEWKVNEKYPEYQVYYLTCREYVEAKQSCFMPHIIEEANKMDVTIGVSSENHFILEGGEELRSPRSSAFTEERYEKMAAAYGYAA